MFCFFSAFLSILDHLGLVLKTAKWMAVNYSASFIVVISLSLVLLQLLGPAALSRQFCCTVILVIERLYQVCWNTILVWKGP